MTRARSRVRGSADKTRAGEGVAKKSPRDKRLLALGLLCGVLVIAALAVFCRSLWFPVVDRPVSLVPDTNMVAPASLDSSAQALSTPEKESSVRSASQSDITDLRAEEIGKAQQLVQAFPQQAQALDLLASDELGAGSMRPKLEAATSFVLEGGSRAVIAALRNGPEAVAGMSGTQIIPDAPDDPVQNSV